MEARFGQIVERFTRRTTHTSLIIRVESADGDAWEHPGPGTGSPAFHLASVTKMYTAALVLKMVEEERVRLDDSVTKHLAGDLASGLNVIDGVDRTSSVTIEHLLRHASGIPDYFTGRVPGGSSLAERLTSGEDEGWTAKDVVEQVRQMRPSFPPQHLSANRVRIRYSDTNYQLLGAVIESAFGEPFGAVLRREMLDPLGLKETWLAGEVGGLAQKAEPTAVHSGVKQLELPNAFASMGPDGGLIATTADAIRFLRVQRPVFDRQRWHRFGLPRDRASLLLPGWPVEYGLGKMRFRSPFALRSGHLVGHAGSSGSWAFYSAKANAYTSGTFDQVAAAGTPYRLVPALMSAMEHPS